MSGCRMDPCRVAEVGMGSGCKSDPWRAVVLGGWLRECGMLHGHAGEKVAMESRVVEEVMASGCKIDPLRGVVAG